MADNAIRLEPAPALGHADIAIGANRIRERTDLALVSLATPIGGAKTLAAAVQSAWGIDLPDTAQSVTGDGLRALSLTADQHLLILHGPPSDPAALVRTKLDGAGYVTDQTDAWVILDISGPETQSALERLCPLDIASFRDGEAARTVMEHLGVLIIRLSAENHLLLSARSSARSFLHAVETSYRNVT